MVFDMTSMVEARGCLEKEEEEEEWEVGKRRSQAHPRKERQTQQQGAQVHPRQVLPHTPGSKGTD